MAPTPGTDPAAPAGERRAGQPSGSAQVGVPARHTRLVLSGATAPPAIRIAAVVRTWRSLIKPGSVIIDGQPPWLKVVLTYHPPFMDASLGLLAAPPQPATARLTARNPLRH